MSIGIVDTSNRQVRPINEISKLIDFGSLENSNPILHPDGDVHQTVEYMKQIVRDHHKDVSKIADKLYDPKLSRFLKNVFDFVMTYVRYEMDSTFMEQLRLPLRTLKDQRGDCDCMSILIGSILYNKNIPFSFRVSKYDANRDFSHVYVIVPRNDNGYYVVDTVIKTFDKEKPYVDKKDYYMDGRLSGLFGLNGIPIQLLNGVSPSPLGGGTGWGFYGLYGDIMAVTMGTDLYGFGLGSAEEDETAMYNHLMRTRDVILAKPQMFKVMRNPLEVARMIDYALRYWDTPQLPQVLGILENEEQRLLREGTIAYPHADLSGSELGELNAGFFKKVGNAVKKATKAVGKGVKTAVKATGKAVATAAKATGKAVAKGAKAVVNVVAKFNPVSLAARGGLLLAIRTNLFKLADKLQYGLYTEAQAQAAGINLDDFRKMQESYNKARNIFVKTLKGNESKFKNAIAKGVKHKAINGLGELGNLGELGAAGAALVTAALGFITSILGFFKGKKNPATGEEYTDESVTEGQVQDLMDQSEMYDEDGNPITSVSTTAQPEADQNFWQKAGGFLKTTASNLVSNYLPSGGGGGGSSYVPYNNSNETDESEYETENQENMIISPATNNSSAVTANVMTGSAMSNIGNFIKKNAVVLGIGAVGIAGAVYFLTRKKKSKAGLSGIPRTKRKTTKRKTTKRLKPIRLM